MGVLLLYSLTLLVAVLLSDLARRTVLSTAVLFLAVGIAASASGVFHVEANDSTLRDLAEFALVSVLFTDGLKISAAEVRAAWRLPARALGIGLPLAVVGNATVAAVVAKVTWPAAFVVAAALAPTTPMFATALTGYERVPVRLRRLLSMESSLSEGLALPILLAALSQLGAGHASASIAAMRLLMGVGIGVAVPVIANGLERLCQLRSTPQYEPILPVAAVGVVYGLSKLVHANEFSAAVSAGVTLATVAPQLSRRFIELGEWVSELLKLAALLIFGEFFSVHAWREVGIGGIWFALAAILVIRPLTMSVALWRSELPMRERVAAAWFGPRGFASVLFALLILETGVAGGHYLYELVALTIVGSIVVHSTTDVPVAKWVAERSDVNARGQDN